MMRSELDELGLLHGTDKASSFHNYCEVYERYFAPERERIRRVLEIGVLSTGSLKMWRDYFPAARVVGVDIDRNCLQWIERPGWDRGRMELHIADATNPVMMERFFASEEPFDLIVDDGAHTARSIRTALWAGFLRGLKPGGWYVIEDLHAGFRPEFNEPGYPTTMDLLLSLGRELNWGGQGQCGDWRKCGEAPTELARWLEAMHWHQSTVLLKKRGNHG